MLSWHAHTSWRILGCLPPDSSVPHPEIIACNKEFVFPISSMSKIIRVVLRTVLFMLQNLSSRLGKLKWSNARLGIKVNINLCRGLPNPRGLHVESASTRGRRLDRRQSPRRSWASTGRSRNPQCRCCSLGVRSSFREKLGEVPDWSPLLSAARKIYSLCYLNSDIIIC